MKQGLKELGRNKLKISNSYLDENKNLIRKVDGVEIKQIEEKTMADRRKNEAINLWRMRNK